MLQAGPEHPGQQKLAWGDRPPAEEGQADGDTPALSLVGSEGPETLNGEEETKGQPWGFTSEGGCPPACCGWGRPAE